MIQKMEKCTKHAAILKAKDLLAVPTDSVGEALKKASELCGHLRQGYDDQKEVKIEPSLAERFHSMRSSLLKSKKAQQYLQDRNLNNKLEIGYNSYQICNN